MKNPNKKRKMKQKQNQKKNPTLPFELIVEILLRLPVRSLLRFKSVCTSWYSVISEPSFAERHYDLAASPTFRVITNYTDNRIIETVDIDASLHDHSSASLNLSVNLSKYDDDAEVLCSCRGFILLTNVNGELFVWNPVTGVRRRVDAFEFRYVVLYGIGYDPSTDDYLVVFLKFYEPDMQWIKGLPPIVFFSFKTNSVSEIMGFNLHYKDLGPKSRCGVFLNGAIHWLVKYDDDNELHVIVAYDVVERSLFEIPLSYDLAMELEHKEYYLRDMRGLLCLCYCGESDDCAMLEIWMMTEYAVPSSWIKCPVLSVNGIPDNSFIPLCFTKSGVVFGSNGHQRLIKLNGNGELLEHNLFGSQKNMLDTDLWPVVYRESLLSLPGDDEEETESDFEEESEDKEERDSEEESEDE